MCDVEQSNSKEKLMSAPVLEMKILKEGVLKPAPEGVTVRCRIIVYGEDSQKSKPTFNLFLDIEDVPRYFLLASRWEEISRSFIVSRDSEDFSRASDSFVAEIKSCEDNSHFHLLVPVKSEGSSFPLKFSDMATIHFGENIEGMEGPRKITVSVSSLEDILSRSGGGDCSVHDEKPYVDQETNYTEFYNVQPKWSESTQSFTLNLTYRVTEASTKNFQLSAKDNPNHVVLQHGLVGSEMEEYTLDFRFPLSTLQAFAVAVCSHRALPADCDVCRPMDILFGMMEIANRRLNEAETLFWFKTFCNGRLLSVFAFLVRQGSWLLAFLWYRALTELVVAEWEM